MKIPIFLMFVKWVLILNDYSLGRYGLDVGYHDDMHCQKVYKLDKCLFKSFSSL